MFSLLDIHDIHYSRVMMATVIDDDCDDEGERG